MAEDTNSLAYTPTWVVAGVCFVIVLISILAERGLHRLGKFSEFYAYSFSYTQLEMLDSSEILLKHRQQDALFEALQKLKEELMLLGFISLLLTAFQGAISRVCIPAHIVTKMVPCKRKNDISHHETYTHAAMNNGRRLLSESSHAAHCLKQGKVQLLSLEALDQLHIFIFVMALVHVIFCATTMVLGGARVGEWKRWEDSIRNPSKPDEVSTHQTSEHHRRFVRKHTKGYWRKAAVISWLLSFFRQFYGSITKSDYIALRHGFITAHCPQYPEFDFHKYMMRTLEVDFKKIVGISWYLWLFVVVFLLLNVEGWNTFFWLAFLPVILLLLVGAKLEHIISLLAQEVAHKMQDSETAPVEPSDKHFWFGKPKLVLLLIHFILFQNAFEIAFFFWILSTYGLHSCMIEKLGFVVTRLIMGIVVQVLCSYSTLPLYALVSQMGTKFRKGMFDEFVQSKLEAWFDSRRKREEANTSEHQLIMESSHGAGQEMVSIQGNVSAASTTEHPRHLFACPI